MMFVAYDINTVQRAQCLYYWQLVTYLFITFYSCM